MRVVAWLAALLGLAVVSAGAVAIAQHPTASASGLTASHQPAVAMIAADPDEAQSDPPHVIPPASPSPSPAPPARANPPAPSSAGPAPVRSRPSSIVVRSLQQSLINADRASRGLGPLTWSSCLYNVAVSNAKRIASQGYLSHTNGPYADLACRLGSRAGENIGYWSLGINDTQINTMFMNSPEHYANIMGPYHYVATAWVVAANGYGYIAVEFG